MTDKFFWVKIAQVVVTAISVIISLILAIKKRKIKVTELLQYIITWITEAEMHKAYTGAEKLNYVLSNAFKFCVQHHIYYNETQLTNEVERLLSMTKVVNADGEDNTEINPLFTGGNK